MLGLGRRYDNLFKSVVVSLERFYELLTQSKNIANQFIKHQKPEISTILNDCLRKVADDRVSHSEGIGSLEGELMLQRARLSESTKTIKIKTQVQEQLEQ